MPYLNVDESDVEGSKVDLSTLRPQSANRAMFLDLQGFFHTSAQALAWATSGPSQVDYARSAHMFCCVANLELLLKGHDDVVLFIYCRWPIHCKFSQLRSLVGPLGRWLVGATHGSIEPHESILDTAIRGQLGNYLIVLHDSVDQFHDANCPRVCPHVLCNPLKAIDRSDAQAQVSAWLESTRPTYLDTTKPTKLLT